MKVKDIIKQIISSHSGISSKRVCGILGFLVIMFSVVYCTVQSIQAPNILETFIWAVAILLGVDSVTGIWKQFNNGQKS